MRQPDERLVDDGNGYPADTTPAITYVAKALYGTRWREATFSVYAAYFDRSGTSEHGHIVVAGLASTIDRWAEFEGAWRAALEAENVPYFHAKEFAHSTKAYADGWKDNEARRIRFIESLATAIDSIEPYAVAVDVWPSGFAEANKRYQLTETYANEFAFGGRECGEWVRDWLTYGWTYRYAPIEYIFDRGEDGWGSMCKAFVADGFPEPIRKPSRDDPKTGEFGIVQLQAADFAAYEYFKMCMTDLSTHPMPELRKSGLRLFRNLYSSQHVYGVTEISIRCDERGIARRMAAD